jgi:DNA-binding response OmpR family regulator
MNKATILVVDDDAQIRRVLQATLSSNGYDVIEAKDGSEAIASVLREHPNLILLDVNMPAMSGFEACRKIRLSFDGPIIMVTVRGEEQDKVIALDSGADDYVVKPFGSANCWPAFAQHLGDLLQANLCKKLTRRNSALILKCGWLRFVARE